MNQKIFFFFYNFAHQSVFGDKIIVFFAQTFPYLVILFAGIFLLFHHDILNFKKESIKQKFLAFKNKWPEIVLVFFSGIFAWGIATLLKVILKTPRPAVVFPQISSLLEKTDFSFPSGHATFFMALAVAIFFSHKKAGYYFIFFAIIIGLARITAGVHFPIDILGGFILGALIAYLVKISYQRFHKYNLS